jgi:dUTP pyrophosphatase
MTSYLLELKIVDDDWRLINLYEQEVAKMKTEKYKNNPYKDSGFDVYTPKDNVEIHSGYTKLVDMKIQCAAYKIVSDGETCVRQPTAFFMYPRSSIYKTSLRLANNTGIIDSGYRGNLMGAFDNISRIGHTFPGGVWSQDSESYNRLLQICMPDLSPFSVKIVNDLEDTIRGGGGFGSTGK